MGDPQFNFQVKKKAALFAGILFVGICAILFFTCNS